MNRKTFRVPVALYDKPLTPFARDLYIYLLYMGQAHDDWWPPRRQISADLGVPLSSIRRSLRLLEKEGVLRVISRQWDDGTTMPNAYELLV